MEYSSQGFSFIVSDEFKETIFLNDKINDEEINSFFKIIRKEVLSTIVSQFGLSKVYDTFQDGGNVTTLHNARKDIFAVQNQELKKQYTTEYNKETRKKIYEKNFPNMRKQAFQNNEKVLDSYTNKELHKDGRSHLDHVTSAAAIHKNDQARLFVTDEERGKMAVNKKNLVFTDGSLNQSKGEHNVKEWMERKSNKREETNAEHFKVDKNSVRKVANTSEKHIKKTVAISEMKYYGKNISKTSIKQGLNMAQKQAVGVILIEITDLFFNFTVLFLKNWNQYRSMIERKDAFLEGIKKSIDSLKQKLPLILENTLGSGFSGFISGTFSNIVNTLINMIVTTSAKFAKLLNDTFHIVIRVIKLIKNRPDNMTTEELNKEIFKLISLSLTASLGIILVEGIKHALIATPLLPISDSVAEVISAILMGIISASLIYAVDHFDEILHAVGKSFEYIKYNSKVSAESIRENYEKILLQLDNTYLNILISIENQYEQHNQLAELAYDMNNLSHIRLKHSVNYAKENKVPSKETLTSITEIDQFFNN